MKQASPSREAKPAAEAPLSWPRRATLFVVESLFAKGETWIAAFWICAAGLFLSLAWTNGPQQVIDARHYASFTGRVSGMIVESWLAIELDPGEVRDPAYWHVSAFASPCAVIEYQGEWSTGPTRRAYCGSRLQFNDEYTLAGVRELAPGVPFRWPRDGRGFIVPEIRIDKHAYQWLASGAPVDTFMHARRPAKTMLDELRYDLDEPVDAAIAGWLEPPIPVTLAFDPREPERALPEAVVNARKTPGTPWFWFAIAMVTIPGLIAWYAGINMLPLFAGLAPWARWTFMVLLLATLPWWADYMPRALAQLNPQFASVIRDMFSDAERTTRFVDSTPEDATLAGGMRISWNAGSGTYADTLGAFKLETPTPSQSDPDAALRFLTGAITAQVAQLDDGAKVALFRRLKHDVESDLDHAGIAFLPAAGEVVRADSGGKPAHAAREFLEAWSNVQHLHTEQQLAQHERERIAHAAAKLPAE